MPQVSLHAPIGDLTLSEEAGRIVSLDSGWGRDQAETPLLLRARTMLQAYFDGEPIAFDLPLAPAGTVFQQRVWNAILAIPRGRSVSYAQLAAQLGTVARAVGQACARNPIPILIPCHRIRSAQGSPEFYSFADGAATKAWLLVLERGLDAGANPNAAMPRLL